MCYPFDAKPPEAPAASAATQERDLVLTSKDGTRFAAVFARPTTVSPTGIVVLPDVRGLFPFYEELARGFARQGINAVAFDYFGRTAGVGKRDAEFEFMPHVGQTRAQKVAEDVGACLAFLRSPEGGSNSWLQAASGHDLNGVIGFYGRPGPSFVDNSPGPLQRVAEMQAPVLALMGGADPMISVEQVDEYRAALDQADVPNEVVVYPGAPHSFFDRSYQEHADASADAWRRVLDLIHQHA